MKEHQPTTKQIIAFAVVLSFIVSMIGTVLSLGIFAPLFGVGETISGPFLFNRPKILERIVEKPAGHLLGQEELIVKAVEEVSPAVVSIVASRDVPVLERYYTDPFGGDPFFREFFGDSGFRVPQYRQKGTERQEISSGSGFIVSSDGLVMTNKHVVADTEAEFTVLMNDGSKKPAKVLARDAVQDLAILKIEGKDLPTARFGDSSRIKIGQTAIAIGNALGEFRNTVSVGVVSGLERSIVAGGSGVPAESLEELIQTDAAINPGNSGGPLINMYGEVIGINTAVAAGAENIGFAIPSNRIQRDVESVKSYGKIVRPYLGIRYTLVTKETAEKEKLGRDYGARIMKSADGPGVMPGSPAEKAGLQEGDIVLAIAGARIDPSHTLVSLIEQYQVGEEVALTVFRDGKEFEIKVKLEERK